MSVASLIAEAYALPLSVELLRSPHVLATKISNVSGVQCLHLPDQVRDYRHGDAI